MADRDDLNFENICTQLPFQLVEIATPPSLYQRYYLFTLLHNSYQLYFHYPFQPHIPPYPISHGHPPLIVDGWLMADDGVRPPCRVVLCEPIASDLSFCVAPYFFDIELSRIVRNDTLFFLLSQPSLLILSLYSSVIFIHACPLTVTHR